MRRWRLRPYTASDRLRGVDQPKLWGIDHSRAKKAVKALRKKMAAAARRESRRLAKEEEE